MLIARQPGSKRSATTVPSCGPSICFVCATVLIAVAACSWQSARGEAGGPPEFDNLVRNCYRIIEPHEQIQKCLAILDGVKPILRSAIYARISFAYFQLKDFDNAIE